MKIFLIEDDKALANLISATIEKYGFDVTIGKNFQHLDQEFLAIQ